MKFLKNYLLVYTYIPLSIFLGITFSMVSIFNPELPIFFGVSFLVITIPLCFTKIVLTVVVFSDKGIKLTYFKKTLIELSWDEISDMDFGMEARATVLRITTYKYKEGKTSLNIQVNSKKLKYAINRCVDNSIKDKLNAQGRKMLINFHEK